MLRNLIVLAVILLFVNANQRSDESIDRSTGDLTTSGPDNGFNTLNPKGGIVTTQPDYLSMWLEWFYQFGSFD